MSLIDTLKREGRQRFRKPVGRTLPSGVVIELKVYPGAHRDRYEWYKDGTSIDEADAKYHLDEANLTE